MELMYTTHVIGLVKKGLVDSIYDAVIEVYYRMEGSDKNGTTVGINFVLNCEVDPKNFVPFNSLSEQHVLSWISNSLSEDELNNRKSAIQDQFNRLDIVQLSPDTFPWNLPTS